MIVCPEHGLGSGDCCDEPRSKYEDELIAWKPLTDEDFVEQLKNLDKLFPPESRKSEALSRLTREFREKIFKATGGESHNPLEIQRQLNRLVQDTIEKGSGLSEYHLGSESRKLGDVKSALECKCVDLMGLPTWCDGTCGTPKVGPSS